MIRIDPEPRTLADVAADLFRAYRSGDTERMSELVEVMTPIMWHTARAQRLDTVSAEDVVQSVWLAFVRSAESITDPQGVLKWLLVATKREAWRVVKRADRTQPTEFDDNDVLTPARDLPEQQALRTDDDRRLWQHIAELSERCQALLRVIAFADRPDYATVAESLDMPVGSIGPTRGRCLAKLRQLLADDPSWEN